MITIDTWETLGDIKDRTQLRGEVILATIKEQMRDQSCQCRLSEDFAGCKIPEFRTRPKQPQG